MDVALHGDGNARMAHDFAEGFDVEMILHTTRRECMVERVECAVLQPCAAKHTFVFLKADTRLHEARRAGQKEAVVRTVAFEKVVQ